MNLHTENCFRNLMKSTWNQIVFTIFRMIWNSKRTSPFAVPNQPKNGKYNLISVWFKKIWKTFLRVYRKWRLVFWAFLPTLPSMHVQVYLNLYIFNSSEYILNLVKFNQILIVITIFRLICVPKRIQSEKLNYNPNLVWFSKIHNRST